MDVIESIYQFAASPFAQTIRMAGYVSFAAGLWYLTIAGFHADEGHYYVVKFRYLLLAGSLHHTFVAAWAGLAAVDMTIPMGLFNVIIFVTTSIMQYGAITALWMMYKSKDVFS